MLTEDVLPGALAIGVPYETFWKLNPVSLKAYEKAYRMNAEAQAQISDSTAWLHGAYVSAAIASCFSKGGRVQYPKKPHGIKKAEELKEDKLTKFQRIALRQNARLSRNRKEG